MVTNQPPAAWGSIWASAPSTPSPVSPAGPRRSGWPPSSASISFPRGLAWLPVAGSGEGMAPGEFGGGDALGVEAGEPVRACAGAGGGVSGMPRTGWKVSCAVRPRTAAACFGSCTPGSSTMTRRAPDCAMAGSATPSVSTRRRSTSRVRSVDSRSAFMVGESRVSSTIWVPPRRSRQTGWFGQDIEGREREDGQCQHRPQHGGAVHGLPPAGARRPPRAAMEDGRNLRYLLDEAVRVRRPNQRARGTAPMAAAEGAATQAVAAGGTRPPTVIRRRRAATKTAPGCRTSVTAAVSPVSLSVMASNSAGGGSRGPVRPGPVVPADVRDGGAAGITWIGHSLRMTMAGGSEGIAFVKKCSGVRRPAQHVQWREQASLRTCPSADGAAVCLQGGKWLPKRAHSRHGRTGECRSPGAGPPAPIPNAGGLATVSLSSRSPHCGQRPGYQAVSPEYAADAERRCSSDGGRVDIAGRCGPRQPDSEPGPGLLTILRKYSESLPIALARTKCSARRPRTANASEA